MKTLISADEFRERFDLDSDLDDKRINPHIRSASRRLRKWVSDAVYENAIGEAEAYEDLQDCLKNAEAHLTYHFAISGFNYPLSSKGIVGTIQSSEGKEMRKFLSPQETAQVAKQFLELAEEIAEPYMIANQYKAEFKFIEEPGFYGEC